MSAATVNRRVDSSNLAQEREEAGQAACCRGCCQDYGAALARTLLGEDWRGAWLRGGYGQTLGSGIRQKPLRNCPHKPLRISGPYLSIASRQKRMFFGQAHMRSQPGVPPSEAPTSGSGGLI